ncbi:CzcR-like response regulator [Paracoccus phage vB_PmaS-R3]|uniref:CzcR-like response regulator n=1 Tax=Paracoccus phage vB_PmaS-R3 TaxID=2494563 RepID=A0A0B5A598_9CAUD|nr:transcriptional regulator [Paracoccus phage vB_PmaS-R3]AJD83149.1 CzcR-like response regulator [Paracoccus phage vB_PmaS-R3]
MQNILNLQRRGYLTEQQLLHAYKFAKNPNAYTLAPTFYRILHDAIVKDEPLEAMEKRKGWPARSAKAMIGLILHAMQEMQGSHADEPDEEETTAKERLSFVVADNIRDVSPLMTELGLTHREARLFLILQRSAGQMCSKETLLTRLYHDQIDDAPDVKIIDVFVCKTRKKLIGSSWRIDTIWGEGYRLVNTDEPDAPPKPKGPLPKVQASDRNLRWYKAHVYDGESLRAIAKREGVYPSTVMRTIHKLTEGTSDEELDEMVQKLPA